MDINSRMVMKPGMQLTAEALNDLIGVFYRRQSAAMRVASAGRIGVMPGHKNRVHGMFVRDTFEVEIEDLFAITPAGNLLSINETAVVKVPMLYGECYYLAANMTDTLVPFEADGLPFVRNAYSFEIMTFDDMVTANAFPLVRFLVQDGVFSVDEEFIMPALMIGADQKMIEVLKALADLIEALAEHHNLAKCDIRHSLYNYVFRLNAVGENSDSAQVIALLGEIANAIHHLILEISGEAPEDVPSVSLYDIQHWMIWLSGYVQRGSEIVANAEVEDEKIDLESIKQELRAEIYEHLQPDLEQMVNERVDNLSDLLQSRIEEALRDYVNGTVMNDLHDRLRVELDGDLRATLYADLYQSLYSVLFVPKNEEEDAYIPLI